MPKNQNGQIFITLLLLVFTLIAIYSFKFRPSQTQTISTTPGGCQNNSYGQDQSSNPNPPIFQGPLSTSSGDDEFELLNQTSSKYRLIRSNLPVYQDYLKDPSHMRDVTSDPKYRATNINLPDQNSYHIYYPTGKADIDNYEVDGAKARKIPNSPRYYLLKGQKIQNTYSNDGNLIFLVRLDASNQEIISSKLTQNSQELTYVLSDVYQLEGKDPPPNWVFKCPGIIGDSGLILNLPNQTSSPPKTQIKIPTQNPSVDNNQLQLEYFSFDTSVTKTEGGWSAHCKPAIYLYPTQKTKVNVKVLTKGVLTYTDPKYPPQGWDVTAYPDGTIDYFSKTYPYLYYESKIPDQLIKKPTQGYFTKFDNLSNLYDYLLPNLGLDQTQTTDFKSYWQKTLPYAPYYFVGIISQPILDQVEPLEITPKPDTLLRIRIYFQPLETLPTEEILNLPQIKPQKNGFTVVEWGGMFKKDPFHPFTCSQ